MKHIQLWPVLCGFEMAPFDASFNDALRGQMIDAHRKYSNGPQHWHRIPHNLFDKPTAEVDELRRYVEGAVDRMVGRPVMLDHFDGREIVRRTSEEIWPHTDRDEGEITAQYFLDGEDPSGMTPEEVWSASNAASSNAFSICDPSLHGSEVRLPWEGYHNLWITPFKGMLVIYPSRLPHFQRHYEGEGLFVQIVMNMKVVRANYV